ncbi:43368_t:CDS:2 [Gigaspora margarita]|uniref:43368_t:CDS:1 n=1 Tax=Gigaspora margarita TaxID=4874 RepID=A0ABN7UFS0_GIGMA|nr:43368_t:CDS:2 [Gigaspora margarita]
MKKLSPNLHNSIEEKKNDHEEKKRTIITKPAPNLHNSIEEKKTNVKKPSPSLYDSIEEQENNCEEAITKSLQLY